MTEYDFQIYIKACIYFSVDFFFFIQWEISFFIPCLISHDSTLLI